MDRISARNQEATLHFGALRVVLGWKCAADIMSAVFPGDEDFPDVEEFEFEDPTDNGNGVCSAALSFLDAHVFLPS